MTCGRSESFPAPDMEMTDIIDTGIEGLAGVAAPREGNGSHGG